MGSEDTNVGVRFGATALSEEDLQKIEAVLGDVVDVIVDIAKEHAQDPVEIVVLVYQITMVASSMLLRAVVKGMYDWARYTQKNLGGDDHGEAD